MPSVFRIVILAALLPAIFSFRAPAVTATAGPEAPFAVDAWDTEAGLPQNSVISLCQTHDGYLWLGTLNGLARFDGRRFTVYDGGNTPELKSSRIIRVFEDSRRNLWVGTETAGIVRFGAVRTETLRPGANGRESRLAGICEDALGAVWLYTADGQLARYLNGKLELGNVGGNRPSLCRALIAEKDGPVWVGTDWRQRGVRPGTDFAAQELPLAAEVGAAKLDFLLASAKGGYWRLADGRIQRWVTNRLEKDFGGYPWSGVQVSAACEDRAGNLVVGTLGDGLYWFDAAGVATHLTTQQGLAKDYVLSLLMDREGNLWVGTDGGGLNRVRRQGFSTVAAVREQTVQSVCAGAAGGLWIGINSGGLYFLKDGQTQTYGAAQGLMNLYVRSVFLDQAQQLWVGTYGGLFRLEGNSFQRVAGSPFFNGEITAIFQDLAGRLWVGTPNGVACREQTEWKFFTSRDGLAADDVRAIAEAADGSVWFGTGNGLSRWQAGKFTPLPAATTLAGEVVSSLLADATGDLWMGTEGNGLARRHADKLTRFTTADGLASNSIGQLLDDGLGNLWIGSYSGLMRVAKADLVRRAGGGSDSISIRLFGRADGLPTSECTQGSQPTGCRSGDGRLWFPTIKGLVVADPAGWARNATPPPVVIEAVWLDGRRAGANDLRARLPEELVVAPGQERLEIQFTSLNLTARERARFKYQLAGHEKRWNELDGAARTVTYPQLPPGQYRFRLLAANEDNVWNEAGATLAIRVLPPFWRTWWFLGASALALLGLVVAVVHFVSTQKLTRQVEQLRQQELLERERARIARDIHDQLGASLTQVALLGEFVEGDKDLPEEVAAHGRQISQTARDTTHALDEIVWTVNPANDTAEGLITYLCKYAQDYFGVAGLHYRLEVPESLPAAAIPPELRHNIFLAAKEAITNVVKHARASSAWLRVRVTATSLTVEIADDGCGPAAASAPSSRNGLRNMRRRMEDVGGTFALEPGATGGTVVRLTAPLGRS